jgi:hypothetical protein
VLISAHPHQGWILALVSIFIYQMDEKLYLVFLQLVVLNIFFYVSLLLLLLFGSTGAWTQHLLGSALPLEPCLQTFLVILELGSHFLPSLA